MTDDKEKLEFAIRDADWATDIQNGLESYMTSLYESVDAEKGSPEADVVTESGQPFCACNVCEGREILSYIVPRAIQGFLMGAVALYVNDEEVSPPSSFVQSETEES